MTIIEQQLQQETPIKLQSECFVKPKIEVEAAKNLYPLAPADLVMLSIDPIQKGLLFTLDHTPPFSSSKTNDNNVASSRTRILSNLLEKLKHSLSIALVHFYPLAGRFTTQKNLEENSSSIFIDCNKGPGARLIHASALNLTVSDVLSPFDVSMARYFFDLGEKSINYDGHTNPLLSIQVTELIDGVFIGFSLNHAVADGTSFIQFVKVFSEIFRTDDQTSDERQSMITKISSVPVFNYRPWLSNNLENKVSPVLKFKTLNVEELICREYNPGPLRERIFQFSTTSMAKLKAKANQECGTNNVISSFQALTALVWRSITRVRKLPLDQQTTCFLAIGARGRLDPPVSDDYFGNIISKAEWSCKVDELLGNGLGWTAMNLRKLISAHDVNMVLDLYTRFALNPMVIPRGMEADPPGKNGVIMGGSTRFDIYGSEFGLGRTLAVRMGYGNKEDGKITANPGCEGRGSVDLEICLRPHIMAALEADQEFMNFVSQS